MSTWMYLGLLVGLACFLTCRCSISKGEKKCGSLKQWLQSTSVSLDINNRGFHREAVTTVELNTDLFSGVRVLLVQRWPSGIFVDPYQLAFLSDKSDWKVLLDSAIDLEVPAHKATGFITFVYPTLNEQNPGLLNVTIPIHGRYHKPSFDGKTSVSIEIEPPELLLWTEECTQLNNLDPYTVVNAPCTAHNASTCQWIKILKLQGHGHMTLQFPVGDGSLMKPVCSITLLVTMVWCIVLTTFIWKHRLV